jgi:hypothetical protein
MDKLEGSAYHHRVARTGCHVQGGAAVVVRGGGVGTTAQQLLQVDPGGPGRDHIRAAGTRGEGAEEGGQEVLLNSQQHVLHTGSQPVTSTNTVQHPADSFPTPLQRPLLSISRRTQGATVNEFKIPVDAADKQ